MEKIKFTFYLLVVAGLFVSCAQTLDFEEIEYDCPYKFNAEIEDELARDTLPWKHQISATEYSLKGDYENAMIHWDSALGMREAIYDSREVRRILSEYEVKSASDYIIKRAENHRVVIINEAHQNSSHRIFTRSLLKKLYNKGFTCLGLEALGNGDYQDSMLMQRGYPVLSTGYYTKDPHFASMIRSALNTGYIVFPYETSLEGAGGKSREQDQARNIVDFMMAHPDRKIVLHCGFDHVLEGDYRAWDKTMAGFLKEYSGLDPLTIDQTEYSPRSSENLNHDLINKLNISSASVMVDSNDIALSYEEGQAYADIAVIHPLVEYQGGRPGFVYRNNEIHKLDLSQINKLKITYPIMLMLFKTDENPEESIPIDIVEVESKDEVCNFTFPPSKFKLVIYSSDQKSYMIDGNKL